MPRRASAFLMAVGDILEYVFTQSYMYIEICVEHLLSSQNGGSVSVLSYASISEHLVHPEPHVPVFCSIRWLKDHLLYLLPEFVLSIKGWASEGELAPRILIVWLLETQTFSMF